MTMAEKIYRARTQRRWSQSELAEQVGVTQAAISRLESGAQDNPTADVLRELALSLGMSMDYLAGLYEAADARKLTRGS
jgi:transcriptional regulator with XRE-family HTH domain